MAKLTPKERLLKALRERRQPGTFAKFVFPLIQHVAERSLLDELVAVQPMQGPTPYRLYGVDGGRLPVSGREERIGVLPFVDFISGRANNIWVDELPSADPFNQLPSRYRERIERVVLEALVQAALPPRPVIATV